MRLLLRYGPRPIDRRMGLPCLLSVLLSLRVGTVFGSHAVHQRAACCRRRGSWTNYDQQPTGLASAVWLQVRH